MQRDSDSADSSNPRIVLYSVKRSMSIVVDLGLGGQRLALNRGAI